MRKRFHALAGVALLGLSASVHAQSVDPCPALPADSGLTWEYRVTGGMQFCRALRADGTEAFGLFISAESPFKPSRSNRAEASQIDGRPVQWYRSEIAGNPEVRARETLLDLPDGRVAHVWIQARSDAELGDTLTQTRALRFGGGGAQLSRSP